MLRPLVVVLLAAAPVLAGPGKKEADRAIADLRSGKGAKVKMAALKELGKIAQVQTSLVASAADDVAKLLADPDTGVRAAAAETYGQIDPDPTEAVPALLKLLTDDADTLVRAGAARGLGAMGTAAAAARGPLEKVARELNMKLKDLKAPTTPAERTKVNNERQLVRSAQEAARAVAGKKR
jgi:HEAT repeat protein